MSYLEVFGMLIGVGVDVSKFYGVGAGVLKPEAGAESESEKMRLCSSLPWVAHAISAVNACIAGIAITRCREGFWLVNQTQLTRNCELELMVFVFTDGAVIFADLNLAY